jgi:hypothetical protein
VRTDAREPLTGRANAAFSKLAEQACEVLERDISLGFDTGDLLK